MKTKEIKIGGVYSSGKAEVRKVTEIVAISDYHWRGETIVRYIDEKGRSSGILLTSLASWAKERLE